MGGELQVDRIEAQKHLATLDGLAGIDQALQHLAGHAETQVALHPGRDDAGEGARCSGCRLDGGDANQWRVSAGIGGRLVATGEQHERNYTDQGGQKEVAPAHEEPVAKP